MIKLKKLKFTEANSIISAINCALHQEDIEILQTNSIPLQKDIPEEERGVFAEWIFLNITPEQTKIINNIFG